MKISLKFFELFSRVSFNIAERFFLKFFFLYFSFHTHSQNESDIFNYNNSLTYSEYLVKTRQFNLAIPELERILFMNPQNDTAKIFLLESYQSLHNCKTGVHRASELIPVTDSIAAVVAKSYARLFISCGQYEGANSISQKNVFFTAEDKFYISLNSHLFSKNWQAARQFYESGNEIEKNKFPQYNKLFSDISFLRYKRPFLAAGLSVIIPGAGKIYTKNWKDAIIAFVAVSGAAFQSYRGFSKKGINSAYGWIFGTLAVGFYSGNIYGSHKAAKIYNEKLDENIYKEVETIFDTDF